MNPVEEAIAKFNEMDDNGYANLLLLKLLKACEWARDELAKGPEEWRETFNQIHQTNINLVKEVENLRAELAKREHHGLTDAEIADLVPGVYRVWWIDATHDSSVAAVGNSTNGAKWLAPANWFMSDIKGPTFRWDNVARVELIEKG